MNCKIIASLVFVCLLPFLSKAQPGTIKAREVIEKFYEIYESPRMGGVWAKLEKRKGNWYIKYITEVTNWETLTSEPVLFYNGIKKTFAALDLEKRKSTDTSYIDYINGMTLYVFDIHPYHGYQGWYKDVIREYAQKKKLTDWELHSLGMAYTTQAIAPVIHMEDALAADFLQLPFSTHAFSQKQLHDFLASSDSAISKFRQLSARNPAYPTKVGTARVKYAHEIAAKFQGLLTFSVDESYKMHFPQNIYSDSLLNANRARLKACPPNAILYSSDDADFYPVFYLQQSEGLRKDVYLVNYYLLYVDRHIYRATQMQFESKGVVLSVDTFAYRGHTNDYFMRDDSSHIVSARELTVFLQSGNGSNEPKVLAANQIDIPLRDTVMAHIKLGNADFLTKGQWVLLDILSNLQGRKMCFVKQLDDELKGLNPYLKLQDGLFVFDN